MLIYIHQIGLGDRIGEVQYCLSSTVIPWISVYTNRDIFAIRTSTVILF